MGGREGEECIEKRVRGISRRGRRDGKECIERVKGTSRNAGRDCIEQVEGTSGHCGRDGEERIEQVGGMEPVFYDREVVIVHPHIEVERLIDWGRDGKRHRLLEGLVGYLRGKVVLRSVGGEHGRVKGGTC